MLITKLEVKETKELIEKIEAEIKQFTNIAKAELDEAAKRIIKKYIEDKSEKD